MGPLFLFPVFANSGKVAANYQMINSMALGRIRIYYRAFLAFQNLLLEAGKAISLSKISCLKLPLRSGFTAKQVLCIKKNKIDIREVRKTNFNKDTRNYSRKRIL
jgi:hypothetical protein